ncbi:MAG TPA: CBS domain-containing protein [Candidatus Polarisedimenticolia bacterium]|nr:CBS domain-containing protein [Candidatus Polarisedimenticolia bacterium]
MTIEETLRRERLGALPLSRPTCVHSSTPLGETLKAMQPGGIGAVLVCDGEELVGIFTERDVLFKLFGGKVDLKQPIEKFMTRSPKVLSTEDTLGDALRLMTQSGYRNIPLRDEQGRRAGMITTREIIKYVAEHFPAEVMNLPPHPEQTFQAPEGA